MFMCGTEMDQKGSLMLTTRSHQFYELFYMCQVSLQRSLRDLDKKDALLRSSQRALEEQEAEIMDYQRELEATETENRLLRHSMDRVKDDAELTRCVK